MPLTDTNPDLDADPWGSVKYSPGLTEERLCSLLNAVFRHSEDADNWRRNPSKWPDSRLSLMPPTIFALADNDVLSHSAIQFGLRMRAQGVSVLIYSASGIHQVKDMGLVTKGSKDLCEIVLYWCAGLLMPHRDPDFARRIPGGKRAELGTFH